MILVGLFQAIQYIIAPFIGAVTAGVVYGHIGVLAGILLWVIDEALIFSNITGKHCLTYAIVEAAVGSAIGIQIQEIVDRKLIDNI